MEQSDPRFRRGSAPWREVAYPRYRSSVELPLLVLAVLLIPLLLAPVVFDLSPGAHATLTGIDWFIWALFAADYLIGLALAPSRRRYVRTEWLSLLLVALPFLRPLRIVRSVRLLRLLRLTRVVAAIGRGAQGVRRLLVRHKLHYALLARDAESEPAVDPAHAELLTLVRDVQARLAALEQRGDR